MDYLADYNKASKEYQKQVEKEEQERIAENKENIEKKKKDMKDLADMKIKQDCSNKAVGTATGSKKRLQMKVQKKAELKVIRK